MRRAFNAVMIMQVRVNRSKRSIIYHHQNHRRHSSGSGSGCFLNGNKLQYKVYSDT